MPSLRKQLWLNICLGIEPRRDKIALASATYWREIILGDSLHDWGRLDVPFHNYNLIFALQLRKNMESFGQDSWEL
jgi:hypothetical protein